MDENLIEIAKRLAHLLAESPLDEEIKQVILDGLDRLPEDLVFRLMDSLEAEREELDNVALDAKLFLENQERDWEKLAADQKQSAEDWTAKKIAELETQFPAEKPATQS